MADPISDFIAAMTASGILPIEPIADKLASGNLVRFRAEGDKRGRRNGWALLHLDGVPAGAFGHFRLGIRHTWRSGAGHFNMSDAERSAMMARARERAVQRTAETEAKQKAAAGVARDLWRAAGKADPEHGYLVHKGLPPFGIRQQGDTLLVPMVDCGFRLWNVQRIFLDGRKLFLSGGRTDGLFWPHGAFWQDGRPSVEPLVIGEGFATMAAVHHATGHSIVAAMSARNLEAVAHAMRSLFPNRILIFAADDDRHLKENIGLIAARNAAEAVKGLITTPLPLIDTGLYSTDRGVDFADISDPEIAARIAEAWSATHD